jgi:hypothetical protein
MQIVRSTVRPVRRLVAEINAQFFAACSEGQVCADGADGCVL